jgi:alpha-D-ribose 1-methylphosphonate 5-triphosphate synthase subunit PhnI
MSATTPHAAPGPTAGERAGAPAEPAACAGDSDWLELDQITERLPLAVDRAMGEGGLWAPRLAARALRQAQGDPVEAAQLLRAHRAALPRLGHSDPVTSQELAVTRRISSAFRNPPGGQVLGRTLDYVGRLLDLLPEEQGRAQAAQSHTEDGASTAGHGTRPGTHPHGTHAHGIPAEGETAAAVERNPGSLLDVLRQMRVVAPAPAGAHADAGDPEPFDITRRPVRDDAPRSAWLQAMARADTGSLMHMWYGSNWRPAGHEIPGEVRHGTLPVRMTHPHTGGTVTVTRVRVSEVQTFHSLPRAGELRSTLDVGYGLCFGHNDRKAISMAGLDLLLARRADGHEPHHEVLFTLDGLDSTGYAQHMKLPHHVEFRSVVERARAVAARRGAAHTTTDGDHA